MIAVAPAVTVTAITPHDIPRVAEFLHANLNSRVPADRWAGALDVPWDAEQPNAGFMLVDGDAIVGAHLAFYSQRMIDGRPVAFCNLAAWCVLPDYRFHGIRLLKALLAQDGYHFTDLSPSGNVVGINKRLGFESLDVTTALAPNLPWPSRRGAVISDPAEIERTLSGPDLQLYRDHAGLQAARHVVLRTGREWCYVVFRADRWRRVPRLASILYASNPRLLRRMWRQLASHLLVAHGLVATLAEERIVEHRPRPSVRVTPQRLRMFRSPTLTSEQVDYLYSELACVAW
jgi:hypothetical protein